MDISPIILSAVFSLLGCALTWVITVAVMKQRVNELEQKIVKLSLDFGISMKEAYDHIGAIEKDAARCEENRRTTGIAILKLDERKAEKDQLDTFRSELHNLSTSLSDRFNRLEDLLNKVLMNNQK